MPLVIIDGDTLQRDGSKNLIYSTSLWLRSVRRTEGVVSRLFSIVTTVSWANVDKQRFMPLKQLYH